MERNPHYAQYVCILREELCPAMGCTEPVAIAYAAAIARRTLGCEPLRCEVEVSGNIIKNVKSVSVPNTGGLKGIAAAAAAGITEGDAEAKLEVLSHITEERYPNIRSFLERCPIRIIPSESELSFYLALRLFSGTETSEVVIENFHTNIVSIKHNGTELCAGSGCVDTPCGLTPRDILSVEEIVAFADCAVLADVEDCLNRQIEYNSAISNEGLTGHWGAEVGRVLLEYGSDDTATRAKAAAAAGSDARMSGCGLPVVIVSGSGNQGLTASMPVIVYARELGVSHERLLRALIVSNLITIHQKTGIGRLSAYCGAVSAGCGAGAGIAYLKHGGDLTIICHTIVNAVAILSGMVCDGAKPSCAAKIAAAVDAGILGYNMFMHGTEFLGGDGIVAKGVENTIRNVGRMAKEGMRETDRKILSIMVGEE